MREKSDDLATIAVFTTSKTGQKVIAQEGGDGVRKSLARSWKLHPETANLLAAGNVRGACICALRAVSDVSLLDTERAKTTGLAWAVRNERASEKLLLKGLRENLPEAACNPNTPEDARRKHLTAERVEKFAHKSGSTTYGVVRNHELANANPWALEAAGSWPVRFRRALSALPQASIDNLIDMGAEKIRYAKREMHPSWLRLDVANCSIEKLLSLNHPAADILALESDRFKPEHLVKLHRSEETDSDEQQAPTLPHIIARAYNQYGPAYIRALDSVEYPYKQYYRWPISGTRQAAAAWLAPGLVDLESYSPWVFCEIETAEMILGECEETWRMFLNLVKKRDRGNPITMLRTAGAARKLVHGRECVAGVEEFR